jgi:outer membrane protein OmpA-like peptidoglycan-associated protein
MLIAAATASAQLVGPVVAVTGRILSYTNHKPLSASLVITDLQGNQVNSTRSNSADGYYYLTGLKPGRTYILNIREDGFFHEKYKIKIPNTDLYQEMSRDFLVRPKKKNTRLRLPVPPFERNKAKLRYGAEFLLEDFAQTLKNNPNVVFRILAYPDNDRNEEENLQLATKRARSLKEYFVDEGVEAYRIKIKGYQTTDPNNPPPFDEQAKGKRYIGSSYIVVLDY